MKIHELKNRLQKERPQAEITLGIPADVVEDLKKVAAHLGFSNYQALIRAYIGQGLRTDLEKIEHSEINEFIESLRRRGVNEEVINSALSDLKRAA
jgi:hypothetical protein